MSESAAAAGTGTESVPAWLFWGAACTIDPAHIDAEHGGSLRARNGHKCYACNTIRNAQKRAARDGHMDDLDLTTPGLLRRAHLGRKANAPKVRPVKAKKAKPVSVHGLDVKSDTPCATCGKPVAVIVLSYPPPFYCQKSCAGIADKASDVDAGTPGPAYVREAVAW